MDDNLWAPTKDVPSPVLSNKGSRPETPASFQKVATLVHVLPPATYDLEALGDQFIYNYIVWWYLYRYRCTLASSI